MSETPAAPVRPAEVARVLAQIATLMELNGEDAFRARAYSSAARALEGTDADLLALARADRLTELHGVGQGLAAVIREIVLTGRSELHEELVAATPVGLFEVMRIPGLGTKRIRALHEGLGVDSLDSLEKAARSGEVAALSGFGAKTQEKILEGIAFARASQGRRRYPEALETAARLLDWLRARPEVRAAEIAGALRRLMEVVDGLVLVAVSEEPADTLDAFLTLNGASGGRRVGERAAEVRLSDGLPARLLCVPADEFVAAMVRETGSDAHLEELAGRAEARGLRLDEHGLLEGASPLELPDEEALYHALGLAYVPPELREGLGEVESAAAGPLPALVETADLRGTFHCHTSYSDGKASVAEMADAARALGWDYLGLADHSRAAAYAGGLTVARVKEQQREIDRYNAQHGPGFRVFKGTESDILPDGSLDYPDEVLASFDYVVGSVHSSFGQPRAEMTERVLRAVRNPRLTILGHPTGRLLLGREGYAIDLRAVIDAAAQAGVVIEINANPHRLDLDWREVRYAVERGVLIAINPDAHSTAGLRDVAYGVNAARKAGLEPSRILNCWTLNEVERFLAERKHRREA
ncbi:MAG TPA: DNA polymerase/3'-5' exonuclease PolX [Longimicrobiaceae bacterium]|nr:DNA polymerase/3'-5' exonuclease PolX [Longimicrobiaceae bacterium]